MPGLAVACSVLWALLSGALSTDAGDVGTMVVDQSKRPGAQLKSVCLYGHIRPSLCLQGGPSGPVGYSEGTRVGAGCGQSVPEQPGALQATAADRVCLSGGPVGEDGRQGRVQTDALAPHPGGKWVRAPACPAPLAGECPCALGETPAGSPIWTVSFTRHTSLGSLLCLSLQDFKMGTTLSSSGDAAH